MSLANPTPTKLLAFLCEEREKCYLEAFDLVSCELVPEKSWNKVLRGLGAATRSVLLTQSELLKHPEQDLLYLKKKYPQASVVFFRSSGEEDLCETLSSQGLVDLVLSVDVEPGQGVLRMVNRFSLPVAQHQSGKAAILQDCFLKNTANMPKLGDSVEVHQGLLLDEAKRILHRSRQSDDDIAIVRNEAFFPYSVVHSSYYWTPDSDFVISSPPDEVLKSPEKLLLHIAAPPLKAGIDRAGRYVGRSFYILHPKEGSGVFREDLCALLNSRIMDFFMHRVFAGQLMVAGENLRASDIRAFAIPPAFLGRKEPLFGDDVLELEQHLSLSNPARREELSSAVRQRLRELKIKMNSTLFDLFAFGEQEQQLLTEMFF